MATRIQITVDPDDIHDPALIRRRISQETGADVQAYTVVRRSLDARSRRPRFILQIECGPEAGEDSRPARGPWKPVGPGPSVVIVGAGPAGYFAALELIRLGIRPLILERGQDVRARTKTVARLLRHGSVDPESNYCFGEGGAGTYSDGKLYTQSTKRGDVAALLGILVAHGADPQIRVDAHPHIGSNKLPTLIANLRQTLLSCGGEIHFNSKVADLEIVSGRAAGVLTEDGRHFRGDALILAAGHSAREIFDLFQRRNLAILPKPFAVGLRLEHPQVIIDQLFYHRAPRHPNLPPAAYRFVSQVGGRGVYSFCMCPGGFVVPASTAPGELAVNGMSYAKRNSPFANSGIVVEIRHEDVAPFRYEGAFAFLAFQKDLERKAFEFGGGVGQRAPAQRMTDFVEGRLSSSLPETSYLPGVRSAPVHALFPAQVYERLKNGLRSFEGKRRGFLSAEALVLAVESRTSSPVRIPRDPESLEHPGVRGLHPCGEGAGYAGGIVSSALDGQQVARKVAGSLGRT